MDDYRKRGMPRRPPVGIPKTRICARPNCGQVFAPKRFVHIYCSRICTGYMQLRKYRDKHGRNSDGTEVKSKFSIENIICANPSCGNVFTKTHPRKIYCSAACGVRFGQTKSSSRATANKRLNMIRVECLTHYGNGRLACVCCGETELGFLTIDHVNGGGRKHTRSIKRSGPTFYLWLIQQGYPLGYQTLCMNCNLAKARLGECPHVTAKLVIREFCLPELSFGI